MKPQCFDESTCVARLSTARVDLTVFCSKDGPYVRLIASTFSVEPFLARESLIRLVVFFGTEPDSTWTIRKQVSDTREVAASLDSMVLENPNLYFKKQLFSSAPTVLGVNHMGPIISVWEYGMLRDKGFSTRSIYVNSQLRASSDASMQAFAESFVHPALISHPNPRIVAIVSDAPVVILKELLRYKSIDKVYLFGVNMQLVEILSIYLPAINDCSSIGSIGPLCMESNIIEIVDKDLKDWSELSNVSIDVVLVDAAMSQKKSSWIDSDFYGVISEVLEENDGIVNVNVGNPPMIGGDSSLGSDDIDRDVFFSSSNKFNDYDLWVVYAYDEPSVKNFPSAFALIFWDDRSLSYKRFLRTSPAAFDLDMIKRFHNYSVNAVPTLLYDGPTHLTYKTPSRAWENWYCQSKIGNHLVICNQFLNDFYNPVLHVTKTTTVKRDPVKGKSLYAVKDIKMGTWINSDDPALQISIDGTLWDALQEFIEEYPDAEMYKGLRGWFLAYGFENESTGNTGWSGSIANINTFTNHACDERSINVGVVQFDYVSFDLAMTRRNYLDLATVAKRDISAGEELQMDYSVLRSELDNGEVPEDFQCFIDNICSTQKGLVDVN